MGKAVPFTFIDVFASEPLTGNPLAVVEGDALSVGQMQRIAREFNQSETTFLLQPTRADADWKLRSFTPAGIEVFGAGGHNTLGAWWWLGHSGKLALRDGDNAYHQEIGATVHPLSIYQRHGKLESVVMRQQPPEWGHLLEDRTDLARALGLTADDMLLSLPCQVVSTGAAHLMVPISSHDAVDRASPEVGTLREILKRADGEGCYLFSPRRHGGTAAYARFFNPTVGISEDPATGTAAGPLAAHLVRQGAANSGTITIEQGAAMGRPSMIDVVVRGNEISISAHCTVAASGQLHLSESV
jgi:PhzF family phenazine biosynthesis protein